MKDLMNDPEYLDYLDKLAEEAILQQIYERGDKPY